MSNIREDVKNMSRKNMERTIYEILTDNGMDEKTANDTVNGMTIHDMERYLTDAYNSLNDDT